jgi:hypothetical protein
MPKPGILGKYYVLPLPSCDVDGSKSGYPSLAVRHKFQTMTRWHMSRTAFSTSIRLVRSDKALLAPGAWMVLQLPSMGMTWPMPAQSATLLL